METVEYQFYHHYHPFCLLILFSSLSITVGIRAFLKNKNNERKIYVNNYGVGKRNYSYKHSFIEKINYNNY